MYYYESVKDDSEVENKLRDYANNKLLQNRGFPEYFKRIRREGKIWNHKRVERVYKNLGMNKRKKHKRRIPNPNKQPLAQPIRMNLTWSMDFMEDRLENGRKVRILNIIDDFNREALLMQVEFSFPSAALVDLVKQVIEWRGKPESIRTDNGTEFIAHAFETFCTDNNIEHIKTQKGKPMQNGYIERFNGSYRKSVLDAYIFQTKQQLQEETDIWMEDYNNNHPHESLGDRTPLEFPIAINCGKPNAQSSHTGLPQLTAS
jgi:putative transposase